MKIKSFAILAMTGLLAASCAYIAPAMADDMNGGTQAAPSDQMAPSDMSGSPQNNDNMGMNMSADNNSGTNNPSNEQASPDTATGDDDY
jgi:hypothetical protein